MNGRTVASLVLTTGELVATIVLADLRLAGEINWSWWWVTAPLWLPVAVLVLAFAGLAMRERVG